MAAVRGQISPVGLRAAVVDISNAINSEQNLYLYMLDIDPKKVAASLRKDETDDVMPTSVVDNSQQ